MAASKRQIRELLAWAERFPVRRWAVESANGHGYLLAQQLVAAGEHVVDVPFDSGLSGSSPGFEEIAEERRQ